MVNEIVWRKLLQDALDEAKVVEQAEENSSEGQLLLKLQDFCQGPAETEVKEELLIGKVFNRNQAWYFRLKDFMDYLTKIRFNLFKVHEVAAMFNKYKIKKGGFKVGPTYVALWVYRTNEQIPILKKKKPKKEAY